jgi:hypothetical protein
MWTRWTSRASSLMTLYASSYWTSACRVRLRRSTDSWRSSPSATTCATPPNPATPLPTLGCVDVPPALHSTHLQRACFRPSGLVGGRSNIRPLLDQFSTQHTPVWHPRNKSQEHVFACCPPPPSRAPHIRADAVQTAYVLSYSVIMLNTDQHNPTVKRRMTVDDFVRNNRGIDDERDLPREFLEELYTRIKTRQIMMRHTMIESTDEGGEGETKYELDASWMESIFALFGRTRELRSEATEGQIVQLEEFLKVRRALRRGSQWCPVSSVAVPWLQTAATALRMHLSLLFHCSDAPFSQVAHCCLYER